MLTFASNPMASGFHVLKLQGSLLSKVTSFRSELVRYISFTNFSM